MKLHPHRIWPGEYHPASPIRHRSYQIERCAQRSTENARVDTQCPLGVRLSADDNKFMQGPSVKQENKFTVIDPQGEFILTRKLNHIN